LRRKKGNGGQPQLDVIRFAPLLHVNGSPIGVSGQLRSARVNSGKAFPSNSLFIKSCFCLWPVRTAFKARFVPVISVVDSDAILPFGRYPVYG